MKKGGKTSVKSELLRRARAYEAERMPEIPSEVLPHFHVTGGLGWINDPNGFSLYRGEYHLFYQYNPYSTHWDTMHWGHVKTCDFIKWERLPCALAPDEAYDKDGCFSGSAVELPDGRHMLMYTGVRKTEGKEFQTQCIAFGDGTDYVKYGENPVIDGALLPDGGSRSDFRDPKLWLEDGKFFAVAGNRCPDGSGAVLLFESADGLHWRRVSVLAASGGEHGRMWECPDLFRLDGKRVLLVSPQEMLPEGLEFMEGNTTLYIIGELLEDGALTRETVKTIDCGLDFYAPQTLLSADGRRIMIAWMQYWDTVEVRPRDDLPFFGQMTVPRELCIRNGRLIQNPVRELKNYRSAPTILSSVKTNGRVEIKGVSGRCTDLTVRVRPVKVGSFQSFTVRAAEDLCFGVSVTYRPADNTVTVDRSESGWPENVRNARTFEVSDRGGEIELRLIIDRYSLELFVNGGEQAASFVIFSPEEADGISFESDGDAEFDAEHYTLTL